MNLPHKIKPLPNHTLAVFSAAPLLQPLSAAEAEPAIAKPVAWHVSNADVARAGQGGC